MGEAKHHVARAYHLSDVSWYIHDYAVRISPQNSVARLILRLPGRGGGRIYLCGCCVCRGFGLFVFLYRYGLYGNQLS